MGQYWIGDAWTEACLLKAEEALEEARARSARRALLRDARPPRRTARVWLGSVLLALGHRLLRSVPGSEASARIALTHDRAPTLFASTAAPGPGPRPDGHYPRGN
jgi:hypothetical protein